MSDLMIDSNTSVLLDVAVTNQDGTVRDITDATLDFTIYDAPNGNVVVAGTAEVTDGPAGEGAAYLVPTDTDDIEGFHVFWYKVNLTEEDGSKYPVKTGKVFVNPA